MSGILLYWFHYLKNILGIERSVSMWGLFLVVICSVIVEQGIAYRIINNVSNRPNDLAIKMTSSITDQSAPLLLRVGRGEKTERVPVWMMRQAGRHMKVYRDLCAKTSGFRERSENVDLATEISLQPWKSYKTDGCILFSDILTPLPGMGVNFDILDTKGPVLQKKWTTMDDAMSIKPINPSESLSFIGQILSNLRREVGNEAAVLGFVGLPYTLATYLVEGGSSKNFKGIKTLGFEQPNVLRTILERLARNIAEYAIYQIENGAQVLQVFDSWAGILAPTEYDTFALPYQRLVIQEIKKAHPEVPIIIYIHKSGAILEKMANTGADILSLDWTINIDAARARIGKNILIQGNLDPMVLFAPDDEIKRQTERILELGQGRNHIMNLGHGIEADTKEEKAAIFINTVKNWNKGTTF